MHRQCWSLCDAVQRTLTPSEHTTMELTDKFMSRETHASRMDLESSVEDDAAIESIAECLAATLGITLDQVGRQVVRRRPSLGELMRDEYTCVPSRDALDKMTQLRETYEFAQECYQFAAIALHLCQSQHPDRDASSDLQLSTLSSTSVFYLAEYVNCGNGKLQVGGLGAFLLDDVRRLAEEWLWDCDSVMSRVHNEQQGSRTEHIVQTIKTLALKIGRCHTNMSPTREEFLPGRDPFFDTEKKKYLNRGFEETRVAQRLELQGVQHLLRLSDPDIPPHVRQQTLTRGVDAMRLFVQTAPKYISSSDKQKINLSFVSRITSKHVPFMVKEEISARWAHEHGSEARNILTAVVIRHSHAVGTEPVPDESNLLLEPVEVFHDGTGTPLPPATWVDAFDSSVRVATGGADVTCTTVGCESRRCLRIVSMVEQMVQKRFFLQGSVSKKLVQPACLEMQVHARMAMELVYQSKLRLSNGVSLLIMLEMISDRCSDRAHVVGQALCSLSKHSLQYLNTKFNPMSRGFGARLAKVITAMQRIGGRGSNITYPRIAVDTLKIIIPLLHDRRSATGVSWTNPSSVLGDMLRLVGKTDTVTRGGTTYAKIPLASMRRAHPRLEIALYALSQEDDRVLLTHHMTNSSSAAKKGRPGWISYRRGCAKQMPLAFIPLHVYTQLLMS